MAEAATSFKFFFVDELPDYDSTQLIPKKGDATMALTVLQRAVETLSRTNFTAEELETALRSDAESLGVKVGQMFQPIRVAVCGQKAAPPLFETLEVVGQKTSLKRIKKAMEILKDNFSKGDTTIDIVGFSRGAALALEFANEIHDKGVNGQKEPSIRFIGIWDTVASFGLPGNNINLGIHIGVMVTV